MIDFIVTNYVYFLIGLGIIIIIVIGFIAEKTDFGHKKLFNKKNKPAVKTESPKEAMPNITMGEAVDKVKDLYVLDEALDTAITNNGEEVAAPLEETGTMEQTNPDITILEDDSTDNQEENTIAEQPDQSYMLDMGDNEEVENEEDLKENLSSNEFEKVVEPTIENMVEPDTTPEVSANDFQIIEPANTENVVYPEETKVEDKPDVLVLKDNPSDLYVSEIPGISTEVNPEMPSIDNEQAVQTEIEPIPTENTETSSDDIWKF